MMVGMPIGGEHITGAAFRPLIHGRKGVGVNPHHDKCVNGLVRLDYRQQAMPAIEHTPLRTQHDGFAIAGQRPAWKER